MIRIKVCESEVQSTLRLEGQLTGVFVAEVERCWHSLVPYNPVVLDLSGLVQVDRTGRQLLQSMHAQGVMFVGASLSLQDVIDAVKQSDFSRRDRQWKYAPIG